MKIQNQIEVAAPPDELFDVLSDVERVAPLLPGATLEGKEDDDTYAGTVKVKVGPITVSYRGTIYFQELDRDGRRAVMRASGSEINGQGGTEATITATVAGSDSESVLTMDTDMEVRGKVAQFGRGAIGNVSGRILDQFARNLEAQVLSEGDTGKETSESPSRGGQTAETGTEGSGASPHPPKPNRSTCCRSWAPRCCARPCRRLSGFSPESPSARSPHRCVGGAVIVGASRRAPWATHHLWATGLATHLRSGTGTPRSKDEEDPTDR